ncbi:hypothetical protein E2562_028737 [Oryza meyeriana var. granulata]|uniref:Uncharacterized protein n=1 Tax=Oryza meyeriana var. granulata TaxID=110450 RepID=A0A6G1DAS6_9ORYZ|nr:hypothetical protein E2562_028737 [Oryza meyeriana var. granulata]
MATFVADTDRAALVKAFDESRTNVCGLVESDVSTICNIFCHLDPNASVSLSPLASPSLLATSLFLRPSSLRSRLWPHDTRDSSTLSTTGP